MKLVIFAAVSHMSIVLNMATMTPNEIEKFRLFLERTSVLENIPINDSYIDPAEPDDSWENSGKFEGDIILDDKQIRDIVAIVGGTARAGVQNLVSVWPNKEVLFVIEEDHFNEHQIKAINYAMDVIERVSCLNFREVAKDSTEDAVVIIGNMKGCFAFVGFRKTRQIMNLSNKHKVGKGCFRFGSIIHEMLHTIGFYHTHARSDRDNYIDIKWENVKEKRVNNFRKYCSPSSIELKSGYDYNSCMHYGRKAFSKTGEDTIVPKKANAVIGQREGLSQGDIDKINLLYCQ